MFTVLFGQVVFCPSIRNFKGRNEVGEDIVIVSAVRTPIGRYGGAFKEISSGHLASIAIKEAIKRANIAAEQVDEVIFGGG